MGGMGGAPGMRASLGVQILSFSCTPTLGIGAPPPREILDPPLKVNDFACI